MSPTIASPYMKGAGYHMEDYRIKMGMRLKKKRKMLNLTQEQMAEKLNVSIKHYGGAERGRAGLSMENLIEICGILGTDLNYLILGEREEKDYIPEKLKELYFSCPEEKRPVFLELLEVALKL